MMTRSGSAMRSRSILPLYFGVRFDEGDHHLGHFVNGLQEFRLVPLRCLIEAMKASTALFAFAMEGVRFEKVVRM
jgi:hypothetical protein